MHTIKPIKSKIVIIHYNNNLNLIVFFYDLFILCFILLYIVFNKEYFSLV